MRSNPRRAVITSAVGRVSPAAMGWRVGPALRLLDGVNLAVLDVYGEQDFPRVLEAAPARAKVIAGKSGSAQVRVAGADHYFNGKEKALAEVVEGFIKRLP